MAKHKRLKSRSPSPSSLDGERDSPVGRKRRRVAAAPWRRDDDVATLDAEAAVSYTHLTLPTKRIV